MSSNFVYVTFIRTTPEKLWEALTKPEFMKQYWFGMHQDSDWKLGSPWALRFTDGRAADMGDIAEIDPPKRIVINWRNEFRENFKAEGFTRCTMDLEPQGSAVKLTISHSIDRPESKIIGAVSGGWPKILSNLKSFLETGEVLFADKY